MCIMKFKKYVSGKCILQKTLRYIYCDPGIYFIHIMFWQLTPHS